MRTEEEEILEKDGERTFESMSENRRKKNVSLIRPTVDGTVHSTIQN